MFGAARRRPPPRRSATQASKRLLRLHSSRKSQALLTHLCRRSLRLIAIASVCCAFRRGGKLQEIKCSLSVKTADSWRGSGRPPPRGIAVVKSSPRVARGVLEETRTASCQRLGFSQVTLYVMGIVFSSHSGSFSAKLPFTATDCCRARGHVLHVYWMLSVEEHM